MFSLSETPPVLPRYGYLHPGHQSRYRGFSLNTPNQTHPHCTHNHITTVFFSLPIHHIIDMYSIQLQKNVNESERCKEVISLVSTYGVS